MIYVDALKPRAGSWKHGACCRMISDGSLEELLGFAESIGAPGNSLVTREGLTPFFDLGPHLRGRAIAAGAKALPAAEFYDAMTRYRAAARAAAREAARTHRDWIAAGPGRGPYPGRPR